MSSITQNEAARNKLVLESYDSGWRTYDIQGTKFFNKRSPERFDEKFSVTGADGAINEVSPGAAYPSVNVEELGSITASQRSYKKEIPIDFMMKRFDNYGTVLREAQKHGYRSKQVLDGLMASVLLSTESGSFGATPWDALSLANGSHLIGNTGITQSNIVTGALSEATLNTADVTLSTQKDHGGQTMPTIGRWLVVPKALAITAYKLTQSTEGPETANRETGYINTLGIMPCPWVLLDSGTQDVATGNAVDWHLIADKMFNRLEYLVSVEPTVIYREDPNTGNGLYQIEFAGTAAASDYLGYVFGNQA